MPRPDFSRHNDTNVLVAVLREVAASDDAGLTVTYEHLSKALGYEIRSGAGRSRLQSARRILESEKLYFGCREGLGLFVLSDADKVHKASNLTQQIRRKSGKALRTLAAANYEALEPALKTMHNAEGLLLGVIGHATSSKSVAKLMTAVENAKSLMSQKQALEKLFG